MKRTKRGGIDARVHGSTIKRPLHQAGFTGSQCVCPIAGYGLAIGAGCTCTASRQKKASSTTKYPVLAPKRPNDLAQLIQKALPVYGGRCLISIATACLPKVIDEKHPIETGADWN